MIRHRHKAVRDEVRGYSEPVGPPSLQDRRAHGGICIVEWCACGAKRRTNSTGGHTETTGWARPEEPK